MGKKEPHDGEETGFAFDLEQKLERKFGVGTRPETRRAFYRRLKLAVEVHGERAFIAIRTVAAEAAGAREPGKYFCSAALRRLREGGLMPLADL